MSTNDISYKESLDQALNAIYPGLAGDLNLITTLDSTKRAAALECLLGLACQAQNVQNITLGRQALWAIEKSWLTEHIENAAEPLLQLESEWEYRRLLELY